MVSLSPAETQAETSKKVRLDGRTTHVSQAFPSEIYRGIGLEVSETQGTLVLFVKTNYSSCVPADSQDNMISGIKLTQKKAEWYLINTVQVGLCYSR